MTVASRLPDNCMNWNFDSTTWLAGWSALTPGITAPDGTPTAFEISEDNSLALPHYVWHSSVPHSTRIDYVFSLFAKESNRFWMQIKYAFAGSPRVNFNLHNGVIGTVGVTTRYGISPVGNGWYFCWMATDGSLNPGWNEAQILPCSADDVTDYDGLVQSSLYFWRPAVYAGVIPNMEAPFTNEVPRIKYPIDGSPPL